MSNLVRDIFNDYKEEGNILNATIEKIDVYKKSNKIEINLKSEDDITLEDIYKFKFFLNHKFNIDNIIVNFENIRKKPIVQEKKEDNTKTSLIMGKMPRTEMEKKKIIDITEVPEKVLIEGEIISFNSKELRNGKILITFNLYDRTNTITCKVFVEGEKAPELLERLENAKGVKVIGNGGLDSFTRELSVMANTIIETEGLQKKQRQDNSKEKRVELHLHTQLSQMDGITSATDLIKKAKSFGMKSIAITDHGVVQAYPEAKKAAKEAGIKIVYGVEAYFVNDEDCEAVDTKDFKKMPTYHAIILVKNMIGLKNLYKLISFSHLNYFYRRPKLLKSLYKQYSEGLILGSACEQGEIYRAIIAKKSEEEIERIANFYDYLEVQPLGNNEFMVRNGTVANDEELQNINKKIIDLGDKLGKLVVATCDVHFMEPEDEVYRRILMYGQGYTDADNQAPLYFRTTNEMLREFTYLDEEKAYEIVVTNTNKISDMCEDVDPISKEKCPPNIEGAEETIKEISLNKAKELYGDSLPEIVEDRLNKELESIIKNGFSSLYIIAQKLVQKSNADGYLVGSRGSVGSSFVANMLGITEVNSLKAHYRCPKCKFSDFSDYGYKNGFDLPDKNCPKCNTNLVKDGIDIPFETFLGFDGDKEPDIDLNFSGEYQSKAHKYADVLFGEGQTFKAGTISTLAEKTAFGYVKKYYEEKNIPICSAEIERISKGCTGIKKTTGQHPGGIIVVPHGREIYEFCPVQHPADDSTSDIITTHFDYHSIDKNLLKLDMLGHDDPTVIRMLQDLTGIDPHNIPLDDKKTMSIFSSTKALGVTEEQINSKVGTFGVPEFGTKFVRDMLVDTTPKTFEELIRISGLSHGTNVWINNAQTLVEQKVTTLSEAICTRDDIMIYLMNKGLPPKNSFDIMEHVRKGKGLTEDEEKLMLEYKVPTWYIESCNKISYMFPKAHAAAYVTMAFRIAWFKVNYPKEFYAVFYTVRSDEFDSEIMIFGKQKVKDKMKELELQGNNLSVKDKNVYSILEIVLEMYERGIEFLPIDLYKSHATKFLIEDGKIRPPLNSIPGLGTVAAGGLFEAQKQGKFMSIEDLQIKSKVGKAVIELLQKFGCLKGMSQSNQMSLFG